MPNATDDLWLDRWIDEVARFAAKVQRGDAALADADGLAEELLEHARSRPRDGTELLSHAADRLKSMAETLPAPQMAAIDAVEAAVTEAADELESEMRTK